MKKDSLRVQRGSAGFRGNVLANVSGKGTKGTCHASFLSPPRDELVKMTDASIAAKELSLHRPPLGMTLSDFYKKLGLL